MMSRGAFGNLRDVIAAKAAQAITDATAGDGLTESQLSTGQRKLHANPRKVVRWVGKIVDAGPNGECCLAGSAYWVAGPTGDIAGQFIVPAVCLGEPPGERTLAPGDVVRIESTTLSSQGGVSQHHCIQSARNRHVISVCAGPFPIFPTNDRPGQLGQTRSVLRDV